jgi:protoheme IX farnesyltransferase
MMPVVAGARATRAQVFLYSLPMAVTAIAPWPLGLTGAIYGVTATLLSLLFVGLAARVGLSKVEDQALMRDERRMFGYSILYLFVIFGALVADRMLLA